MKGELGAYQTVNLAGCVDFVVPSLGFDFPYIRVFWILAFPYQGMVQEKYQYFKQKIKCRLNVQNFPYVIKHFLLKNTGMEELPGLNIPGGPRTLLSSVKYVSSV